MRQMELLLDLISSRSAKESYQPAYTKKNKLMSRLSEQVSIVATRKVPESFKDERFWRAV